MIHPMLATNAVRFEDDPEDWEVLPCIAEWVESKIRPGCEVCLGTGWVCEEHPLSPFEDHPLCGVGEPCRCTGLAEAAEKTDG